MKIFRKILSFLLVGVILFMFSCKENNDEEKDDKKEDKTITRVDDNRNLSPQEYTYLNLTATDKVDRVAPIGDKEIEGDVGVFFHLWHGVHETAGAVLDLTEIMRENPDYLTDEYLDENPKKFHYWGQPLYGYYCSSDPWVITRHIEVLMAMGIDYVAYDYTNSVTYDYECETFFGILQSFYDQGFKVPKVTFYTNTGSANVICKLYKSIYEKGKYEDLWYSPNGKPMIIGVGDDAPSKSYIELYEELKNDFFDFRESQWPDKKTTIENTEIGFPWMSWEYPQKNFNGMMSVSLAQHPGAKMSFEAMLNYGRGYDWTKNRNKTANTEIGTNYEGQWETVLRNNLDSSKKKINQVLVTGFNEWMAQKLDDGSISFFVDTFSEEYSRDIEMMKGGYDDNYVIQTLTNVRRYKFDKAKHYKYSLNIIDINDLSYDWSGIKTVYQDLVGDALPRDYRDAFKTTTYVDNSNRNDIYKTYVTHDSENLYIRIETKDDITPYNGSDKNWMNILIKTEEGNENSFGSFNFIINRSPKNGKTSIEKSTGGYNFISVGEADYIVNGNVMMVKIPLSSLGLDKDNCYIRFKVSDNVTHYDDIMDYYVSGDSAPIGRFAYAYGY